MRKTLLLVVLGGITLYLFSSFFIENKSVTETFHIKMTLSEAETHLGETATSSMLIQVASSTEVKSFTNSSTTLKVMEATTTPVRVVTHMRTPENVKALYMTSWVAGTKNARIRLLASAENTKINAFIIDVKDNTGVVSWEGRIKEDDLEALIDELHAKGYYLIARVTAFQDPLFASKNKDETIKRTDGSIWKSKKGEAWVDPGSKKMWSYLLSLGEQSYAKGFDEINYDYIRFSTDGLNEKLVFPQSGERGNTSREAVITDFYEYLTGALRKESIPVSGDVFGIITTSNSDIPVLGQNFETALKNFDYVAPMVYPSHYAPGTFGYQNPAAHPGQVITEALLGALSLADKVASSTSVATSTMRAKIRPWYQDFNMGATYTSELVKAQITAGNKLGIKSYMMWDANNTYTVSAYK